MKWLLILLCIIGFYPNISYSQNNEKNYYYGTWEGTSQFITTKIIFKDSSKVEVSFLLLGSRKYVERTGVWRVKEKMVELLLNYEETQDYSLNIKNVDKWYEHKFTIIGNNKGLLIDHNTSIYTVYKTYDKKGKKVKISKKRL